MAVTINGDTGIDKVQDGSIHDVDIDSVSASKLTGDLPAISGVNLTDLSAGELTGALPAISGVNLTDLPAEQLTGDLPAISGANLTGLPAGYTDSDALSLFNASGSAPVYACRAWVNFNGVGAVSINSSGNVSSVQDLGTGKYRVNFSTAMQDTNYAIALGASSDSATANRSMNSNNLTRTTSRCDVTVCDMNGGEFDENRLSVSIIR